jgi:hypothetical protein
VTDGTDVTDVTHGTHGTVESNEINNSHFPSSSVVDGSTDHPPDLADRELLERIHDRLKRENSPVTPFILADKARSAGLAMSLETCRSWLLKQDGDSLEAEIEPSIEDAKPKLDEIELNNVETVTEGDFMENKSEEILNVVSQLMRDRYQCCENGDSVGLYMSSLLTELPEIPRDRLTTYLLENGWIRASDELSEIWWAPDDIVDAYHRPKWLADEEEIVWNRDPSQYSYLREACLATPHPSKEITSKGVNCAFVVGYAINRNGAGSSHRRFWYLAPWDRDIDSQSVYNDSFFPCEAVDPRSIRVGKESKRPSFSGGTADSVAAQSA